MNICFPRQSDQPTNCTANFPTVEPLEPDWSLLVLLFEIPYQYSKVGTCSIKWFLVQLINLTWPTSNFNDCPTYIHNIIWSQFQH